MRFSLVGVSLVMTSILTLAVLFTSYYRQYNYEKSGNNLVVVLLHSSDTDALAKTFNSDTAPLLNGWGARGVQFANCIASSPWRPATIASLLTGLYPSEHGLHEGHAHLTQEAVTLAEKLSRGSHITYAAVSRSSLLEPLNLLQGFQGVETVAPRETITAMSGFCDQLPDYRSFFALVEVDLDAFGGPRVADKVLEVLYDSLGKEQYLARGVLAVVAPHLSQKEADPDSLLFDPRIPVLMVGQPLRIGPGKCMLKNLSICEVASTLEAVTQGQGFNLRDSLRIGQPAFFETVSLHPDQPRGEISQPPPFFVRACWFDNRTDGCLFPLDGKIWNLGSDKVRTELQDKVAGLVRQRYDDFVASRAPVPDLAIAQCSGPRLSLHWRSALGDTWNRPEYENHFIHAVEHLRLAQALSDSGYPALAVGELLRTLAIEEDFPMALFALAEVYAAVNPDGAKRYYREFVEKYSDISKYAEQVKASSRYLLRPAN